MCLMPDIWKGTSAETLVMADMRKESGEEWEYQDRRQEIVFIGHRMKREKIQELMDECLLTDEEMTLGPEKWKETMMHLDIINLVLGDKEEEECEDEECEEDCEAAQVESEKMAIKKKIEETTCEGETLSKKAKTSQ